MKPIPSYLLEWGDLWNVRGTGYLKNSPIVTVEKRDNKMHSREEGEKSNRLSVCQRIRKRLFATLLDVKRYLHA